MTKEEFLEWAISKYSKWSKDHPNEKPAVDRIDSSGHYELTNIQLISVNDNSRRAQSIPEDEELFAKWIVGKCKKSGLDPMVVVKKLADLIR